MAGQLNLTIDRRKDVNDGGSFESASTRRHETFLNLQPLEGSFGLVRCHAAADFFGNIKQALTELWDDTPDFSQVMTFSFWVYRDESKDIEDKQKRRDVLKLALQELREDMGLDQLHTPSFYVPLAIMLLPQPATAMVKVAGITLSTKVVCATAAAFMILCSNNFWNRFPDLEDRTLHKRSACVVALSGAFCITAGFGSQVLPKIFGDNINLLLLHVVKDAVTLPLIIGNIGYILGASSSEVALPILLGEAGIGAVAGANLIPQVPMKILLESGVACAFIGTSARYLQSFAQNQAANRIGLHNQRRGFVCLDLFALSWIATPCVHAASTFGILPSANHLQIIVILDLLNKLGISHLVLNKQPAVEASAKYFADQVQQ